MAPREPTLASCEAQQASWEPPIVSSSETNLALHKLTTAPVGANLASRQVTDGSLHLISNEATPAYSGRKVEATGIALNKVQAQDHFSSDAKAKAPCGANQAQARLSSEAKVKAPCSANLAHPRSEANIASLKASAWCYTTSFTFSSEAKAPSGNLASHGEAKC